MGLSRYVNAIGIEFEGVFSQEPEDFSADGSLDELECPDCGRGIYDGDFCEECETTCAGESRSRPLKTWQDVKSYINECHPVDTNSTCGTHVHFSLNAARYYGYLLEVEQDFIEGVMEAWKEGLSARTFENISYRYRNSGYCRVRDNVQDLSNALLTLDTRSYGGIYGTNKYSFLNVNPYGRQRTFEIRVLPGYRSMNRFEKVLKILVDTLDIYIAKGRVKAGNNRLTLYEDDMIVRLPNERTTEVLEDETLDFDHLYIDDLILQMNNPFTSLADNCLIDVDNSTEMRAYLSYLDEAMSPDGGGY